MMYGPATSQVDPRDSQQFILSVSTTPFSTETRDSNNIYDPFIPSNEWPQIQEHTHNNHTQKNILSLCTVLVFLVHVEITSQSNLIIK